MQSARTQRTLVAMNRMLPLLGALCAACAPRAKPAETSPSVASATTDGPAAPSQLSTAASRTLPSDATYGDLVRTAIAREGANEAEEQRCVLAVHEGGFELRTRSASAIRPLPLPASDLEPIVKGSDEVELLSAWGRYGTARATVAFATFTPHAPAQRAILLILTDRGLALRGPSGAGVRARDGLDPKGALEAVAAQKTEQPLVVLAAESSVPLRRVQELLASLDGAGVRSALAVNLSPDTRFPPSSLAKPAVRCDDGLPATDAPEGALPDAALASGVARLRDELPECLGRGDARGAAGGRLTLAFRVAADGRVAEACITRDDIQDPGVAACVTDLARTLTFAPPSPSGVLDIELPLALRPAAGEGPRALCPL